MKLWDAVAILAVVILVALLMGYQPHDIDNINRSLKEIMK